MKNKIKIIVFSRDRAQQLECLLRSLSKNSTIFNDIYILYKFTDNEYKEGYNKLKKNIYENIGNRNVYFYEENEEGFKNNLNEILKLNREKYNYICFMVDDQILYQKLENEDKIFNSFDDNTLCFSLRLGYNITYRHLTDTHFVLNKTTTNKINDFLKWNWREESGDFNYPLSVDGHIFKYEDILKLIKPLKYFNPNSLEGLMQSQLNFPKNYMVSYEHSKMVNLPINRVQNTFNNRFGLKVNISEKELNDKFLNGEVINFEKMDYSNVNSCHCEIYPFLKSEISKCCV